MFPRINVRRETKHTIVIIDNYPSQQTQASSGKDRRICIWRRIENTTTVAGDSPGYYLSSAADSAHKRIVWSVHFCPSRPDILASGSRDGFVKIWRVVEADDGILDLRELYG